MVFPAERRRYFRSPDQAEVVYTRAGIHDYTNGTMVNCSPGGMSIRSRYALEPGVEVCVKLISLPAVFAARVVWCVEQVGREGPVYGIGIRYPAPVVF
ncbi:MAG: PilZ domain-containing protein [Pseudomonadota bacterium]